TVAPRLRRIASRGPARRQSTGNLLDVIRGNITLPGPVRLPDWSIPIIVALLIIALWFGVRSRVAGVRARRLECQRASLLSDLGAMQAALVPEVPTGRRQATVSLPAGAVACFFRDGLSGAGREGQLLGRGRLRGILTGLGERPDATDLLAGVRAAAQGAPDDMVACVLSPASSRGGSYLHVEELEADAKTLARPAVGRFLRECMVPPAEAKRALAHARQIASNTSAAL